MSRRTFFPVLAATALLIAATTAHDTTTAAQTNRQETRLYTAYGPGTTACRQWTRQRQTARHAVDLAWVLGFVSGVSWSATPFETTPEAIEHWMDRRCLEQPDQRIGAAAAALINSGPPQ